MADVKIAQLLEATTVADTDLFVVEDNADTKKITKENLVETLGINEKANKTQEAWIKPTKANNWVDDGVQYFPVSYFKTTTGDVYIFGRMINGSASGTVPVFTLPVGYRPLSLLVYEIGNKIFLIHPDGRVILFSGSSPVNFSVIFRADN